MSHVLRPKSIALIRRSSTVDLRHFLTVLPRRAGFNLTALEVSHAWTSAIEKELERREKKVVTR